MKVKELARELQPLVDVVMEKNLSLHVVQLIVSRTLVAAAIKKCGNQKTAADALGVSTGFVSRVVNGDRRVGSFTKRHMGPEYRKFVKPNSEKLAEMEIG